VLNLLISDVPGDDPLMIASGPTVADSSTFADALAVLEKYAIRESPAVLAHLSRGADETPKPGDPSLVRVRTSLIAAPQASLEAAATACPSRKPVTFEISHLFHSFGCYRRLSPQLSRSLHLAGRGTTVCGFSMPTVRELDTH
jgi:glycerate-2-kinase